MRRMGTTGLAGVALIWAVGCGGGEDPTPAVQQESAQQAADDGEEWEENSVPVVEWVRLQPESPGTRGMVTATVRHVDPDGDDLELAYAWKVNGRPARESGNTLHVGNARKGDSISLTVTATDGWDESNPVTVHTTVGNSPPTIQGVAFDPLGSINVGQDVTARPVAEDRDGDPVEFEYRWWVNENELSNTGPTLQTSRLRRGDEIVVEVVAMDGTSRSTVLRSQPITVGNSAPRIVSTPINTGPEGVYRYEVKAEDPDRDRRIRFRLEEAPPGMVIDPISGDLVWHPPADAEGSFPVEVVVDDLQGGVDSQRFTVEIGASEPVEPPAAAPAAVR